MVKRIGTTKEMKQVIKRAERQGFIVRMSGNKHIQFIPPDKKKSIITTSLTPSDNRSLKNFLALMEKAGYED